MCAGAVHVAVIDKRVHTGAVSSVKLNYAVDKTFNVDASDSLDDTLKGIKRYAGTRKLKLLTLVSHGEVVKDASTGGQYYTLEFCQERVQVYTAKWFRLLAGCFVSKRLVGIELIACGSQGGAASTSNPALISQGIVMAQTIANASGTVVRASPDTQLVRYSVRQDRSSPKVIKKAVTVTPGQWEKRVWYFFPKKTTPFEKTSSGFVRTKP